MNPQNTDYTKIFSEIINKQILILGPNITIAKAKNVQGLEIDDMGNVLRVVGDPQVVLQNLINQFVELSGLIVKKTMESIISNQKVPDTQGISSSPQSQVTSQVQEDTQVTIPQPESKNPSETEAAKPLQDSQSTPLAKSENSDDLNKMVEDVNKSAAQIETKRE